MKYQCPCCKEELEWSTSNTFRPFCSERCKNNDFVRWANEEHSLKGEPQYDDVLSGDLEIAILEEYRKKRDS